MSSQHDNLYDTLGIQSNANENDIKRAYRRLALKYHPDKNPDMTKEFQDIQHAYSVLKDVESRKAYDLILQSKIREQQQQQQQQRQKWSTPFNLTKEFFARAFPTFVPPKTKNMTHIGPNITYSYLCTLEDLYLGKKNKMQITRTIICRQCDGDGGIKYGDCQTCEGRGYVTKKRLIGPMLQTESGTCGTCEGKGYRIISINKCIGCNGECCIKEAVDLMIDIAPGTQDGHQMIFKKASDTWMNGGVVLIPGDIIVTITLKKEIVIDNNPEKELKNEFERDGDNLITNCYISLETSICGGIILINGHPSQRIIRILIPEGHLLPPDSEEIIKNLGMPIMDEINKFGDLIINIKVVYPRRLNAVTCKVIKQALNNDNNNNNEIFKKRGEILLDKDIVEIEEHTLGRDNNRRYDGI